MIFKDTILEGVKIIETEHKKDNRGFFCRQFSKEEFEKHELNFEFDYTCISHNNKKGTLRGIHFQKNPYEEIKLVQCTKGKAFDVVIDLRKNSNSYGKWISITLDSDKHNMVYIPKGCAHGFMTLEDDTDIIYHIKGTYKFEYASGVRWNDPFFDIKWPDTESVIMKEDDKMWRLIGE